MAKCTVWSIDAWANPEGWDYNDKHWVGEVELSEDATNEDIINALYEGEFINTRDVEQFAVEDYFGFGVVIYEVKNAKTDEPLYEIDFGEG